MGVVFEDGHVVHAFTVWQPEGWTTPEGLELGAPAGDIGATYGELAEIDCGDYLALVDNALERDERVLRLRGRGLGLRPARARTLALSLGVQKRRQRQQGRQGVLPLREAPLAVDEVGPHA